MKAPKLLKIVERFLSADKEKQQEHIKCMKDVLKKLKKKENALKNKLNQEKKDKDRKKIKSELAIIYLKRKKGIASIKELIKKK